MSDVHVEMMIFDSSGKKLADAAVDLQSVSWRWGQTGQAKFSVDYGNPVATVEYLQIGNRMLLRFANGLPDWGGVIALPRSRQASGIGLTAYEGDRLLDWRVTGKEELLSSSPGGIVSSLLSGANERHPTDVGMGDVYEGGFQSREYNYDSLLAAVCGLATGYDYAVVPVYQQGQLRFALNWYQRRGRDLRGSVLLAEGNDDGHNVGQVTLDEQGPVYNRVIVVGGGTAWADRPVVVVDDLDSQYLYGLREHVIISSITDTITLQALAQAALDEAKHPRGRATLSEVTNRSPALFSSYDIGDIVRLQAFLDRGEWAFDGPVRVLARSWTPAGTCTVEVEEWRD